MKKILFSILLLVIFANSAFAYAIKIYDEYGSRIGTAKKVGENYELYDMDGKKFENYEKLHSSIPFDNKTTLQERIIYFYDQDLRPIGTISNGVVKMKDTFIFTRPVGFERYPYYGRYHYNNVNIIRTGF